MDQRRWRLLWWPRVIMELLLGAALIGPSFTIVWASASTACHDSERAALLEFVNSSGFAGVDDLFLPSDNSNNYSIYNYSRCACDWNGVECNLDGFIVSLTLEPESIEFNASLASVPWPLSLAKLGFLQELHMMNFIHNSPLPQEIGLLSQSLTSLSIRYCGLQPPLPGAALTNFSKLTQLDLSSNGNGARALMSSFGYQIPQGICNLTALLYLDLSINGIAGNIPPCISFLPHLMYLDLSSNTLEGPIPGHWNSSSNLQHLSLSGNVLSGQIYAGIFGEKLTHLDLGSNNFTGSIPPINIGKRSALTFLSLSSNKFSGSIPVSLGNLTKLSQFDLSHNSLSGTIPHQLGTLGNLEGIVDFSGNQLSGLIPASLAEFGTNASSKDPGYVSGTLDLSSNNLTGDVPWLLLTSGVFQVLSLGSNQLTGVAYDSTANISLQGLLGALDLSSNYLAGPIPFLIGHLHLHDLDLSHNNLDGSISAQDSASYFNLSLNALDLSWNSIEGPIPAWLSRLTSLNTVDLSFNKFGGTIPDWFWLLSGLHNVDLSKNQLEGEISLNGLCGSLIGQFNGSNNHFNKIQALSNSSCHLLSVVDLHANYLSGPLPQHLLGDTNITYQHDFQFLSLADNYFFGSIPEWDHWASGTFFGGVLDLSHNQLSGAIPRSIGYLGLSSLHLSSNNFSGELPSSLCVNVSFMDAYGVEPVAGVEARSIKLERNSLSGSIPEELGHCQQLTSLVLKDNLLTGSIPRAIANLSTNLQVLDLSRNGLQGVIPPWIQQMQSLRLLILSHNVLSGPLPSASWNTTQLQVLDLSSNNLSGIIPGQSLTPLLHGFLYNSTLADSSTTLYDESISISGKGQELTFTYLLRVTVALDLSSNALAGPIPPDLSILDGLIFLNLSNNHLSGYIPDSFSKLHQLNSLDLSKNELIGDIPMEALCLLTFLSTVDVSDNRLSGPIPRCNQWSTFTRESFLGNKGLCGPPLQQECSPSKGPSSSTPMSSATEGYDFLAAIFVGFGVGFPLFLGLSMLWRPMSNPVCRASRWILGKLGV